MAAEIDGVVGEYRMRRSTHLDEFVSGFDSCQDSRQQGKEPGQQDAIGRIADAEPNNNGPASSAAEPINKVLVLGHDDAMIPQGEGPDVAIFGVT